MTDFALRRRMMVDTQVRPSDVTKFPIIDAMLKVEREAFVPDALREAAYSGENLDLDGTRVLLDPRTLAKMLDALNITGDQLVLDIGCAHGYSSAVVEVTGFDIHNGQIRGVETSRGTIRTAKVGIAVAGHTSTVCALAGLHRLPIESHVLQAMVSEPLKPFIDTVCTFGAGHFYISQSDKGGLVFGGDLDGYNSYAQRGNLPMVSHVVQSGVSLIPALGRLRLLRHWAGVMDMSMDGSPIIGLTPIRGLYLNAGWCYGGFKATPASGWCFAHTMAQDSPHALNAGFALERFEKGYLIDEAGTGANPALH